MPFLQEQERGPASRPSPEVSPSTTTGSSYNGLATKRAREIARRIEGVLAGVGDDPTVPRCIREIDRIRSAALAIIEGNLPAHEEVDLLDRLLATAKSAQLPFLAAGAILEEIRPEAERPANIRPHALRARQLRRAGYAKCPACHLDVLDEATLEHLEARDRDWEREHAVVASRRDRLRGVA